MAEVLVLKEGRLVTHDVIDHATPYAHFDGVTLRLVLPEPRRRISSFDLLDLQFDDPFSLFAQLWALYSRLYGRCRFSWRPPSRFTISC